MNYPNSQPTTTSDVDLTDVYRYPHSMSRPWVRVNFVSSVDGAVHVDGVTAPLGSAPDKRVFDVLRTLADVILVGAGTARAERYGGVKLSTSAQDWRARQGLSLVPPIAVVSGSAALDPSGPLFTDTSVPPLVLTTATARAVYRARLCAAGADVVIAGEDRLDVKQMLEQFDSRGLRRILCEGGPQLFGTLVSSDAVDDLCLTIAPCLVGPGAGRIIAGLPLSDALPLALVTVLIEDDVLLMRYRVIHKRDAASNTSMTPHSPAY